MNETTKKQLKIIAINILTGCETYIKKNLEYNTPYLFYNEFNLTKKDNAGRLIVEKDLSDNTAINPMFYIENLTQSPIVSISGIVGKNGSGKSAIIDIILRLIDNIAYKHLPNSPTYVNANIKWINGLRAQLYFSLGDTFYMVQQTGDDSQKDIALYQYTDKWIKLSDAKRTLGESFFYTILMNYSLYAFNTLDYKEEWETKDKENTCWLNGLFHKNDGYQTPVVLNPMRIKGNIDINRENNLAKDRLISLFFNEKEERNTIFTEINGKSTVDSLIITFDKENVERKFQEIIEEWEEDKGESEEDGFFEDLRKIIIDEWQVRYKFKPSKKFDDQFETATLYLAYKTISIARNYDDQLEFSNCLVPLNQEPWDTKRYDTLKKLITEIDKDNSHITFKLRQTLAFLKFRHIITVDATLEISIDDFAKLVDGKILGRWKYLDFVPAPCFKTEIRLRENNSKETYPFSKLSSGERQLIYSASAILYHIRNLNSVKRNLRRVKYKHLNIILDEIELYFHPEYQRIFIDYILKSIDSLKFQDIESINILLATHSPFILSDIPQINTIRIEKGKTSKTKEQTFGANIHNLLANDFFMSNAFIGEFARNKIQSIIDIINHGKYAEDLWEKIQLIGEPFLKDKLTEMYYLKFEKKKRIAELREELKQLEEND